MENKKISLNQEVKDVVTGFKGIIMGITEYNTGCIQYGVASQKLNKDGRTTDWLWFDGSRLIGTGKSLNIKPTLGGPHQTALQM